MTCVFKEDYLKDQMNTAQVLFADLILILALRCISREFKKILCQFPWYVLSYRLLTANLAAGHKLVHNHTYFKLKNIIFFFSGFDARI